MAGRLAGLPGVLATARAAGLGGVGARGAAPARRRRVGGLLFAVPSPNSARCDTPRTLVVRAVDVGYCVNGSSMPRRTRPSQTTDAWQNPWPKQNDIHEESVFAPYGPYLRPRTSQSCQQFETSTPAPALRRRGERRRRKATVHLGASHSQDAVHPFQPAGHRHARHAHPRPAGGQARPGERGPGPHVRWTRVGRLAHHSAGRRRPPGPGRVRHEAAPEPRLAVAAP